MNLEKIRNFSKEKHALVNVGKHSFDHQLLFLFGTVFLITYIINVNLNRFTLVNIRISNPRRNLPLGRYLLAPNIYFYIPKGRI